MIRPFWFSFVAALIVCAFVPCAFLNTASGGEAGKKAEIWVSMGIPDEGSGYHAQVSSQFIVTITLKNITADTLLEFEPESINSPLTYTIRSLPNMRPIQGMKVFIAEERERIWQPLPPGESAQFKVDVSAFYRSPVESEEWAQTIKRPGRYDLRVTMMIRDGKSRISLRSPEVEFVVPPLPNEEVAAGVASIADDATPMRERVEWLQKLALLAPDAVFEPCKIILKDEDADDRLKVAAMAALLDSPGIEQKMWAFGDYIPPRKLRGRDVLVLLRFDSAANRDAMEPRIFTLNNRVLQKAKEDQP